MRERTCTKVRGAWLAMILLAWAVVPTSVQAAPNRFATEVLADNPFGYWRFNEAPGATTAADLSGNLNHGTYSAAGITLGQPGLYGGDNAALFDGSGVGRVVVVNSATLNPLHITMEALVSYAGPNGFQQRIVEKSFFAGGFQAGYNLSILDDGHVQVELRAGGGPTLVSSVATVPLNVPIHLVGTYDGTNIRIYINGALDTDAPAAFPGDIQANPTTDLGLGNQAELTRPRQFNGIIDEVALYPEALTPERVQAHVDALSPLAALDHFSCYGVAAREPFRPVNVTLRDQFEKLQVTVLRPILLCNPTDKVHGATTTEISNPEAHLTCYQTRPVEPTGFRPRSVIVSNQFGDRQPLFAFLRANILCVPSQKALVTPGAE
jgi:hypothetical protein